MRKYYGFINYYLKTPDKGLAVLVLKRKKTMWFMTVCNIVEKNILMLIN